MKAIDIPAIRAHIGTLTYYIAAFTFKQVAERVKYTEDELHTSSSLREQLQRALSDNHKSIKQYILTQKERFFNSLVLAVYDGEPTGNELEFEFNGNNYYSLGFLSLNGQEHIFPVDGQHRVEGIKEALKENPQLGEEKISVIFIGHHNNPEGKEKSRRIFSTLNRYAKPVVLGDIIALDEDDIVAITTRDLLEKCPLFWKENVKIEKKGSKALADNDDRSFTSLIALYETNKIVYTYYKSRIDLQRKIYNAKRIADFLKYRPEQSVIDDFYDYLWTFWSVFINDFSGVKDYIDNSDCVNAAAKYRNKQNGGMLYFRPIALPYLVKAIFETAKRTNIEVDECMANFSRMDMCIANEPWAKLLWDDRSKTMIMKYKSQIFHMLMYLYKKNLLTQKEKESLLKNATIAYEKDESEVEPMLSQFPSIL